MADEQFPLDLERVVVDRVVGQFLPRRRKVDRLRHVGIPYRLRCVYARLRPAVGQAGDGGAQRAVDMEGREVVTPHARGPRAVDLRDHRPVRAGEFEGGVRRIVGSGRVFASLLVPALRNVRGAEATHAADLAKQVVEHVAPMAQHVDDDAAVVLLAVVPRRPLCRLPVALEHPIAELAADRQDAAEKARVDQHLHLEQARQPELVLHDAVLDASGLGRCTQIESFGERRSYRFLGIDVLARGDRLLDEPGSQSGRCRIEIDRVIGVRERGGEVGRPSRHAVGPGQLLELVGVAADEDGIRHNAATVGEGHAALRADRADRADQVLVGAHPAGDAVHDDAESNGIQAGFSWAYGHRGVNMTWWPQQH